MSDGNIFNDAERELIAAARMILSDGVSRLRGRQSLLPSNQHNKAGRQDCREARDAISAHLIAEYGILRHEVAVAVLMDAQGRLIDIRQFPQGRATQVEVSPRILAGWIVETGASVVLLAHNHPSGDNTPSHQDEVMTEKMGAWLAVMECQLIDHLVLNSDDVCSILGQW